MSRTTAEPFIKYDDPKTMRHDIWNIPHFSSNSIGNGQ
jgi:hypothetical protein